jgi:tripartite-type tricarboxylate transporter receptor subunit TctC
MRPIRIMQFLLAAAMLAPVLARSADYPAKPIRLIVPFAVGGTSDILARLIAQPLGERLGQSVIVDNRPGAGSNVGNELAAHSAPDGYTLLLGTPATASNPALYRQLNYDPTKDLVPVSLLAIIPMVLVVNPSLPVHSVWELIDYAKAHPNTLNFGSSGNGGMGHLTGEMFKTKTDVLMTHVPYRGNGPALTDLMAGTLSLAFSDVAGAMPHIVDGKLRPLATTTRERSKALPDVPTMAQAGVPEFVVSSWFGVFAPAGTPQPIVDRLSRDLAAIVRSPALADKLLALGAEPVGNTPAQFAQFFKGEVTMWATVVKESGAKVE